MRRWVLRATVAAAAMVGAVLLSGCDYWTTCVSPVTTQPSAFTLLLRAALCTNGKPSDGNPIVPSFQMLQLTITGPEGPVVAVPSGATVLFDATSSYIAAPESKDDRIVAYSWDFHGDAPPTPEPQAPVEIPQAEVFAKFTASSPRQVTITLKVTDSLGFAWSVTRQLTVYPVPSQPAGPDTPPLAVFTITPNPAAVGQAVTFDGSQTADERGRVTDYRWDFGDGTPALDSGASSSAAHRYACTGRVTVTLTATNDGGQTGQAREQLFVTPQQGAPPCPGTGPAASFTATPNPTPPEAAVSFDASASNDSSGQIIDYFWEFGDGTHGDSASPTITHSYFCTGTVTVRLTITDGGSMSDQTTRTETVNPASGFPPCSPGGARDMTGRTAAGTARPFFSARLIRVRVLSPGAISTRGSTTTLRGVVVAGSLRGALIGSRGLGRFDRARFIAVLTFVANSVDQAISIRGVALATFPGGAHDQVCLSFDAARRGARVPLGAFQVIGGTGAAARLSGGGTFAFALERRGGRLAGRLGVGRAVRRHGAGAPLPSACRSLQR